LVATIAMGVYTAYLFLPGHAVMILHYAEYFFSAEVAGGQAIPNPVETPQVIVP